MGAVLAPHYDSEFRSLAGKTVKEVGHLTEAEMKQFGWYEDAKESTAILFTDGTVAVISADPEGNGPGFMFFGEYSWVKTVK
jgi:hypothetical protein